jgi:hypothetical protein
MVKEIAAANGTSLNTFIVETLAMRAGGHMPIVGSQYIAKTHTGSHEEIVRGLLQEALEIYRGGMREWAAEKQERNAKELKRSVAQEMVFAPPVGDMVRHNGECYIVTSAEEGQVKVRPYCDADH